MTSVLFVVDLLTDRQTKCGSDDVRLDIGREKKWRTIVDTVVKKGKGEDREG